MEVHAVTTTRRVNIMPRTYEQDTSIERGLSRLSETFRYLAQDQQAEMNRNLAKLQQKNSNLNATAQLIQSIGLYGGELEIDPEAVAKVSGGLISVKPKTAGLKKQEITAKTAEGQAKRQFAREMQDVKFGQQLTLEQVKWTNSMAKVEQLAKQGDEKAAFKALMDHVKVFGVTGGAEDVAKAQRAISQAKKEPLTPEQKPLQEEIGTPTGGVLGFGAKTVMREELISMFESEQRANEVEQNFNDIQEIIKVNPEEAQKWKDLFFEEYPLLKGKIGFTKE